MKRIGVILILMLAFCGLADATYLAKHEIAGTPLTCTIQGLSGCNTVADSSYSRIFGVPVAEYGILFYCILFVLAALELVLFDQILRRLLQIASLLGVIASLYLMSVQVFLVGAFCIYCTASACIALVIFILASFIEPIRRSARDRASSAKPDFLMPPAA